MASLNVVKMGWLIFERNLTANDHWEVFSVKSIASLRNAIFATKLTMFLLAMTMPA